MKNASGCNILIIVLLLIVIFLLMNKSTKEGLTSIPSWALPNIQSMNIPQPEAIPMDMNIPTYISKPKPRPRWYSGW